MLAQIAHCLKVFILYVIPWLIILIPLRFLTNIPSYIFRKLLHFIAFTCVTIMILAAESWQAAALTSILIAVVAYPILAALESAPWFEKMFVQKSKGEIKRSCLMLLFMFAVIISVCWGVFGKPHVAAAAILMWGTGDAAAALVGIPFGKHKVKSRFTDGKKSWEGSLAMLLVSFVSGVIVLYFVQKIPLPRSLFAAGVGALLGTVTELCSPSEYDTITVPAVIAAVLLVILH